MLLINESVLSLKEEENTS